MIDVYLDSNILIGGADRNEHIILKQLSNEGKIALYFSDHTDLELHGRVFPLLRNKDEVLREYEKSIPNNILIQKVSDASSKYEDAKQLEKKDRLFWKDVKLLKTNSRFSRLWTMIQFSPDIYGLLIGELNFIENLLNFGINDYDAFHLTQAYYGKIDYFLTWDKDLIHKSKELIDINKLKIITPKEFIESKIFYNNS